MNQPEQKLSVVLPIASYNMCWLNRCLLSCIGVADELVVVTDGAQFQSNWPHYEWKQMMDGVPDINVITMPRKGLAMALNVAIAAASHHWISFLCSDDWYDLEGASIIKRKAMESTADIVGGITHSIGHLGENTWPRHGNVTRENIMQECLITSPALFRKPLWHKVEGYSDKRYLDWHYWTKCISAGATYEFHPIIMYHYQAWPGTISARYGYKADLGFEWGDGPKER
jgi:glycosyltransferase involved in cell wall biosynthesis